MAAPDIRPFDFSKLEKFSSRQLAINETLIHLYPQLASSEEILAAFSSSFEKDLGLKLTVRPMGFKEGHFSEFVANLPNPGVAILLKAQPQDQKVLVEMDYSLARLLVDQVLTGQGELPLDLRPFTPVEEGVFQYLVLKAMSLIKDAEGVMGMAGFRLMKVSYDGKSLADGSEHDATGCIFKFYLGLGERGGYLRIYLPHPLVEGVFLRGDRGKAADLSPEGLERVAHIKTSLWSEIGRVTLMASEKAQLEKGDVILFDESLASMGSQGITGKAILRVGEMPSEGLLAEVIDTEGKMTVKILDFYGGE